ncbi:MAG: ribonucleoside triphosphate reductase, partial [Candidatus Micrarchaeia archaeon]
MDVKKIVTDYLRQRDWKVRENANITYSFPSMFYKLSGEAISEYTLKRIYSQRLSKAHLDGDFHIHNIDMGICGYCAGWSIPDLLMKGFGGIPGKIHSVPAKHFSTALLQIANFLGTLQNEWAGAMAVNSLDTLLAPFVAKDGLSYDEVKQNMQQFIYNMNISTRWGSQTPFTNVTFDLKPSADLAKQPVIIGGEAQKDRYCDFQDEMDVINKAFLEVMIAGDANERIFTFPLPTYNITKDFEWDSEIADLLFEATGKYGIPYFQNFIKSDLKPEDVRSMCCRLRLDLREFYRRTGGYFGYADKTGSVGVVTINMPRIGYLSKDEHQWFARLDELMDMAAQSLEIKRRVVERNIATGFLPFSKLYLGTLKWHFSTIGIVGMNEACLNFLGKENDISTVEGKGLAMRTLKFMREKTMELQEKTGHIFNLEATPAEGVSHRLARLDKRKYPKIITAGKKVPYYTNSTWLPVDYTDDIFEALRHQEDLQVQYTGGTVFHGFVGERISGEAAKLLVKKILTNFRIPYLTITPTFSICPEHGYISGEYFKCPKQVKI